MAFRIGQLVACIDDHWTAGWRIAMEGEPPKRGQVYTVRDIVNGVTLFGEPAVGLLFEEIRACHKGSDCDHAMGAEFFRPVVTPDISVFTSMLNKPPVPVGG